MSQSKAALARKRAVSARMAVVRSIEDAPADGAMAQAWQDAARATRAALRPRSIRVAP
jgi:hypothetical protein